MLLQGVCVKRASLESLRTSLRSERAFLARVMLLFGAWRPLGAVLLPRSCLQRVHAGRGPVLRYACCVVRWG